MAFSLGGSAHRQQGSCAGLEALVEALEQVMGDSNEEVGYASWFAERLSVSVVHSGQ